MRRQVLLVLEAPSASQEARCRRLVEELEGVELRPAADATEGLRIAGEEPVDAALVVLPAAGARWEELCRGLRAGPSGDGCAVVLAAPAPLAAEEKERCATLGIADLLEGPVGEAELIARLRAVLRVQQAEARWRELVEEQRLRAERVEVRFHDLVEQAGDVFEVLTPDGRFVDVNGEAFRQLGYTREELLGMSIFEVDTSLTAELFTARWRQIAGGPPVTFESLHRRKDGGTIPVEVRVSIVATPQGERSLALVRDISARRQAEQATRESEARYRSLFDNMLNGLAYCRLIYEGERPVDFVYLAVNNAFEALTGLRDVVGKTVSQVIPGIREANPQLFERYGRVARGGQPEKFEVYVEGMKMWFEVAAYSPSRDHFVAVFDVITARKQAQEELRQAHDQVAATLAALPDLMFELDREGRIVDFRAPKPELLYVPPAAFLGRLVDEVLPPEAAHVIREAVAVAAERGWSRGAVYSLPMPGGVEWFELSVAAKGDSTDPDCRFIALARDVTEQWQAQQALAEANEILSLAQCSAGAGVWHWDLRSGRLTWSAELFALFGLAAGQEASFDLWRSVMHPDDMADAQQAIDRALQERAPLATEGRILLADGSVRRLSVLGNTTYDEHGEPLRMSGICVDITGRKQAEDALRASEGVLREAQRIAHVGSWTWDVAGDVIHWSDEMRRIAGWDAERPEPRYGDLAGIYSPESWERLGNAVARCLQDGTPYDMDLEMVRPDGGRRSTQVRGEAQRDPGGRVIALRGTVLDVTEQRQLEERLRQSEKMEAIGRLAGGVAHDFNNMLGAILGYADLIMERTADTELRRYAGLIANAARRSAALTGQLLAFARRGKFQAVRVNLHEVIDDVAALLGRSIDKRITLERRLEARWPVVVGDPNLLNNALLNLALNGRDAMPDGGTLRFTTSVVEASEPLWAELQDDVPGEVLLRVDVADTGGGMDEAARAHLFEPFFTTKGPGRGTGLGLASVYGTVRSHGGAIRVRSAPGSGTEFSIFLPAVTVEPAPVEEERRIAVAGGARLLLVEDEPLLRRLLEDHLRLLGFVVTVAADGAEAVRLYTERWRQIDLVVIDWVMPTMSGPEALVRLREIHPGVRAIVMSGYALGGSAEQLRAHGVAAFLQKPFRIAELARLIEQVLAG